MKAGWEVKPLGEVCGKITDGSHNPPKGVELSDFLMLSSKNVWDDRIIFDKPRFLSEQHFWYENKRTDVTAGDVLLTIVGTIGRCAVVSESDRKFTLQRSVAVLKPLADHIDSRFLMYALQSMLERLVDGSQGAAQKGIYLKALRVLPIPIPPLEEQKRIVAVLDAAFEGLTRAKENAEANLQNARELFEATLDKWLVQDAQEWPKYELSSLGKLTTGGTPKSADAGQYGDALPFIKPGHFRTDGSLDYDDVGLSDAGVAGARIIPENSAVMVCIGATIGKSGYNDRPIATNQQINALTPNDGLHHYFAYLHFITPTFQKQVIANSGQATLPIINKSKWGKLKIGVPSDLNVQQSIVDRMTENRAKVDLAVQDYLTKLADIADLRQSLLQKAFAGELT